MIVNVLLCSVDANEGLLAELPFRRFFGERSLSWLGDLRSPDTRLVILTPDPIPHEILDYNLRDVLGFDQGDERTAETRLVLLSPHSRSPLPLVDLVLGDPALVDDLRREVASAETAVLVNFSPSEEVEELAGRIGAAIEEGPSLPARYWGSKSGSKAAFTASGVRTCRGAMTPLYSLDAVCDAALELAETSPPIAHLLVKLDSARWSGGVGNALVNCDRLRHSRQLHWAVDEILQPWESFVRHLPVDGAIVEEYVRGCSSPSGQAVIDPDGVTIVRASHEQVVVDGQYQGCVFPVPEGLRPGIDDALRKVGSTLARAGVRGTFGIDFLALESGEVIGTEINVRKLGPSHALRSVEGALGDRLMPDGRLQSSGASIAYVHRRRHHHDAWHGVRPAAAISVLRERRLLLDRATRTGAILHILEALPACGYLETTCVGGSRTEAELVDSEVTAALSTLGG